MDKSIFTDKTTIPSTKDLIFVLGSLYPIWEEIRMYILVKYPPAIENWNYPGEKYGWSFKIKDKKRAIIYLLPRDGFFKLAMVFGKKATDVIMESEVSAEIKSELQASKVFAEGRGIRITVKDEHILADIKMLIDIKIR